jgi:hypothetical protein
MSPILVQLHANLLRAAHLIERFVRRHWSHVDG